MRKEVVKVNIIPEIKINGINIDQSNVKINNIVIDEIKLPNKCILKNFIVWLCKFL